MKTYSQLLEDIELTSGIGHMNKQDVKAFGTQLVLKAKKR